MSSKIRDGKKSMAALVMEYFEQHPNKEIEQYTVVSAVQPQYVAIHGQEHQDPWRAVRSLYGKGKLQQIRTGVYLYDPAYEGESGGDYFTLEQREEIFDRDGRKCVVCGRGEKDGATLHADHKIPRSKGGTNDVSNGETLCSKHNYMKKRLSRIEAGKKYFLEMLKDTAGFSSNDSEQIAENDVLREFLNRVLDLYEQYDVNGHIHRKLSSYRGCMMCALLLISTAQLRHNRRNPPHPALVFRWLSSHLVL